MLLFVPIDLRCSTIGCFFFSLVKAFASSGFHQSTKMYVASCRKIDWILLFWSGVLVSIFWRFGGSSVRVCSWLGSIDAHLLLVLRRQKFQRCGMSIDKVVSASGVFRWIVRSCSGDGFLSQKTCGLSFYTCPFPALAHNTCSTDEVLTVFL